MTKITQMTQMTQMTQSLITRMTEMTQMTQITQMTWDCSNDQMTCVLWMVGHLAYNKITFVMTSFWEVGHLVIWHYTKITFRMTSKLLVTSMVI